MARELLTVKQLEFYKGDDVLRDGNGLMLRGSRWVLRVRAHGKRRDLGLGGWPEVGLKQARQKAEAARERARRGVPNHMVGEGKTTFRRAWEQFWDIKAPTLGSARHRAYWLRTMESFALPKLGDRDVADIRAAEVVEVLRPIWTTKPETARRVLQRVKAVFGWGIFAELRERANPCDGVAKVLGQTRTPERHFRSMGYREVPAFFQQLRAMPIVASRSCLAFAILCALRSGEARHAQWDWVLDGLLIVPAEFTKMRRTHAVPLSNGARAVLDEARTWGGPLIFPGRAGWALTDRAVARAGGLEPLATAHGFRSSFKVWAAEVAKVPDEVSEAALAHADKDKVRAAYLRTAFLEERRALMQAWADYLQGTQA